MEKHYLAALLVSLLQIQRVWTSGCDIVSVTSPSASNLKVVWNSYAGAHYYLLDLRVINSTTIAPLVLMLRPPSTETVVRGLRPGHSYQVTLKVMTYVSLACTDTETTLTVPATSQITFARAMTSSSIKFQWSSVTGADSYILFVEELLGSRRYNKTFTTLAGQVDGLTPSTHYDCYVLSSNSAGRGAKGRVKTVLTLVEPPTGVTLVTTGRSTARVTWSPLSTVLLYQVTVRDVENPNAVPVVRNTSSTSMDISNLEPCSNYTVGVSSINFFLVPGEPAEVSHSTSPIRPVATIDVSYSCSNGMVTVSWTAVFGANQYRATAVDGTGAALHCTSESTSCQITMLACGERYRVHVTAISDDCESIANTSALFETVPCAPAGPLATHDCTSNVIWFSWQATNNTQYYVATSTDNTGTERECRTVDNRCLFTNVGCGELYSYHVHAVSSECSSEVSQPRLVRTSPCLPTNVRTEARCQSNMLITTWDSAAGALSYTVEAQGNTGETYSCTSSTNSCAVTGVPCGEHLSVYIVASNDNCTTAEVLGEVAQTVPCTPTNLSATVDCSQTSASLQWISGRGSVFHTAIAEDESGRTHSCNALGSSCLMEGLRCGRNYTAGVIGTNLKCNSSTSQTVAFRTAPCPPTSIEALRDCDANHAVIVWQNHQRGGVYTAAMRERSGAELTCSSDTVNNCKIQSLPCGRSYNVSVTYSDGTCSSTSSSITMDSVPCGPEAVSATVSCLSGELNVTWSVSVPAENYTAMISRGLGAPLYCNATETQCIMGGLLCGSAYMVVVFSVTGTCHSLPSPEVTVQTAPCPPTSVAATHACAPDPVPVSWVSSDSAEYYVAVAVSAGGHRRECSTNSSSCSLAGLRCGQRYSVGVSGADANCTGPRSDTVSLDTEPCTPSIVSSLLTCSERTSQVFWTTSATATSYSVKAISGGQNRTCSGSDSNCTLTDLLCGHDYQLQVTATDGTCVSNSSAPFRQEPVPCAPANLTAEPLCGTDDVAVSWRSSPLPLNYSVTAEPLDGSVPAASCRGGGGGGCSLTGLRCGQTYNVSVGASRGGCSGASSPAQTVHTAPCSPQNLTAVAACGMNAVVASWSSSPAASFYTATVTGPAGASQSCSSSNLSCSFTGLRCATRYNVTVSSQDGGCSSAPSRASVTTGPCDPTNVTSDLQCGSDMASVSWTAADGAAAYTVLAEEEESGHVTSCRSAATSCELSHLQCGKVYNLSVMAEDATCNSSGASGVLMTAPCAPSVQTHTLLCGSASSLLSWTPMADATGYWVNATSSSGQRTSASSAASSCTLTDLRCSETYAVTVTARGSRCDSEPGPRSNISTAPCPPTITSKLYSCSTNTAVVTWSDPEGRLGFTAQLSAGRHLESCRTGNTSCVFDDLPCGSEVNVTVQAEGTQCNSSSVRQSLETVPCPPTNVSATQVCSNHSAVVAWEGSPGARGYNVTASGQDGHTHECHTHSTSCDVPGVHCGETYAVTVTAYSATCSGAPSSAVRFRAGLCAPANVSVSAACEGSVVSWSEVAGADMYVATATADDGHARTCSSNHSNSCNFTELRCGRSYAVTVVTVERGCRSEPSAAERLRTALCPPTDLAAVVSCASNTLSVSWSAADAADYVLQSERADGALPASQITSSNTSLSLSGLLCGQKYSLRIAARHGRCLSGFGAPVEVRTAPCPPANLTARVDCGTNRGNFSWAESGAAFYTVEVAGEHGHVAACSSNASSCAVKLRCGRSYSASLVASTGSCNSTKHPDVTFDSAPCLPGDVAAELDCDSNVLNVSWTQTLGSDDYTAWAISGDGHRASCNSSSSSCSILQLRCGRVYEVAVTSSSVHCQAIAGSDYHIQSAPCKPENVRADQNCSSNAMTVRWTRGGHTAQNYTVEAASSSGRNATCDSSEESCSFLNLSCGRSYTFTVTGHTNVCRSDSSAPVQKHTAPCPASDVSAEMNCTAGKAVVRWRGGAAATGFSVLASADGHNSSCSDAGTSCCLSELVCGLEYSVVVEAMDSGCPAPSSQPTTLITEPCVPVNVSVYYNGSAGHVTWSPARGASSYSVQAVTDEGPTSACNASITSCVLGGVRCGQIYNVSVAGRSRACDSVASETARLATEPCPPANVRVSAACEGLSALVSWQRSDLAVGYVAYLDDQTGRRLSCSASDAETSCSVSGVACGTAYSVRVKALGEKHNSSESAAAPLTTAPCRPRSIEAVLDCEVRSVTVSWLAGAGASSYVSELTASSGLTSSCSAASTHCQLSTLQCGEEYNVSVKAVGESCNSTAHMAGNLQTEPCTPTNLSVHYNVSCGHVTWDAARGAAAYSVEAVTEQGLTSSCDTGDAHCSLGALQCSQNYSVTVTARNHACNNSVTSDPYRLSTEPCPPANVQASVDCPSLTSVVSWEPSGLAVGYQAYLENGEGHAASCETNDTFCSTSGLMCGTTYSVWVKALGETYNSSASSPVSLAAAPCLPGDLSADVSCDSDGAAVLSWTSTRGSANISVTADISGSLRTLCNTPHRHCNVSGLNCGERYNLSLSATNEQCSLTAAAHIAINTRPCPPQGVAVSLRCGSATAVVSWEEDASVEVYHARGRKASGGGEELCNSTGATCRFSGLDCGQLYNFTVTAHAAGCGSEDSNTVLIHTEPCQPVMVSVQAGCQSEDVHVSWRRASGALDFVVTAAGSLGYVDVLNATLSPLSLRLPCGQEYNISVQGRGRHCDSIPSSPAPFKTTPCVPWGVAPYVQCQVGVGSISWGPSDGAEAYVAVATGLDGHTQQCHSNSTSCTWDELRCGNEYTVAVSARDERCSSAASNSSVLHTAPCRPHSLSASIDCDGRVVSLSWGGGNGTKLYAVTAETADTSVTVSTNVTAIDFSDFTCGQNYNLTVAPYRPHCPGNYSASTTIQTWPCSPTAVRSVQDCVSAIVSVTWRPSSGSDYYAASVQTEEGVSELCMSEGGECSVPGLACGYNFSVWVTAANRQCNATSVQSSRLQSVPCVPADVAVVTDCVNNTAAVSWSASRGAVRYTVTARGNHGNDSCTTSGLSCDLLGLACGDSYTVEVVAMDDDCSSAASRPAAFRSGPCAPQNVSDRLSCSSNHVAVSWHAVREADHFLVWLTAADGGGGRSCNVTEETCAISNLTCGNTFSVEVAAVRGGCQSGRSQSHMIQSAPCQPAAVRGSLDCVTNSAWIQWDAAAAAGGVDGYSVAAVGEDGGASNCSTATNSSCEVEDLACGVLYAFSVTARSGRCESPPSAAIELQTAPCSLHAISAEPQCHNASILVAWDPVAGGEGGAVYTATAEASDRSLLSCNSSASSCFLHGAQCDRRYTVMVAASSDQCSSLRSPPTRVTMEPCPPRDVVASPSCEDEGALVSWTPSPVAERYHVVASDAGGHVRTCNATSSNCSLSGLRCGRRYTVSVFASHENCSSTASQNATLRTAPCPPAGLSVTFDCHNQSAVLAWSGGGGAEAYYGCARAADGETLCCRSADPVCCIQPLRCGAAYNFSVSAADATCNSSFSAALQAAAAPCPPDSVEVDLLPMRLEVQVLSFSWLAVSCGGAEYLLRLTGSLLGDGEALFDLSSYWNNATYFELPLPCGSAYSATVASRNAGGSSGESEALNGTTAPCSPSGVTVSGNDTFTTVSWSASAFASSYTVYDSGVTPKIQLCNTTQLSCSLSNMASDHLVVTASNAAGESEETNATHAAPPGRRRRGLTQRTSVDAPELFATQMTPTLVLMAWSEVLHAATYSLTIQEQGGAVERWTVDGNSTIVTDLRPDANYCFSVRAEFSEASGPESELLCVQTNAAPTPTPALTLERV